MTIIYFSLRLICTGLPPYLRSSLYLPPSSLPLCTVYMPNLFPLPLYVYPPSPQLPMYMPNLFPFPLYVCPIYALFPFISVHTPPSPQLPICKCPPLFPFLSVQYMPPCTCPPLITPSYVHALLSFRFSMYMTLSSP